MKATTSQPARRLTQGERFRMIEGDGTTYRVERVTEASATVRSEASRVREIRNDEGEVIRSFTVAGSPITISPFASVEHLS